MLHEGSLQAGGEGGVAAAHRPCASFMRESLHVFVAPALLSSRHAAWITPWINPTNLMTLRLPRLRRWLKAPSGLPALATIDPALILTPPAGKTRGYVPVAVYEGLSKSALCT